jgi:hypothetical protein
MNTSMYTRKSKRVLYTQGDSHRESSKTNEERSGVLQMIDKTNTPNITYGVMGDLHDGSSTCITIGGIKRHRSLSR